MAADADADAGALASVAAMERKVLESPKEVNNVQALLSLAKKSLRPGGALRVAVASVQALKRLFVVLAPQPSSSSSSSASASSQAHGGEPPAKRARVASDGEALAAVNRWVRQRYEAFVEVCLASLHHSEVPAQLSALAALMELAREECRPDPATFLASGLFARVLARLVTHPALPEALLARFADKYAAPHRDLRFFTLRALLAAFEEGALAEMVAAAVSPATEEDAARAEDTCKRNALQLLLRLRVDAAGEEEAADMDAEELEAAFFVPVHAEGLSGAAEDDDSDKDDDDDSDDGSDEEKSGKRPRPAGSQLNGHVKRVREHERALSECWLAFLRLPLPADVYKQVLARMRKQIMPCVRRPLALSDFLTDSYNLGGVASLLALSGLFVLVTEHNLDYPDFYPKLYRLIKPASFHAKYRSRFFVLLGTFLKSTHLPAYLVAAFVKRMARVALSVPPSGAAYVLVLIYNMLRRHPSCGVLLHRPLKAAAAPSASASLSVRVFNQARVYAAAGSGAGGKREENGGDDESRPAAEQDGPRGRDPFLEDEDDPAKCRAMDSSLWEIRTLTNHYCPLVARSAKVFGTENAPKQDYALQEHAEHTYESIMQREMAWRSNQLMPLAVQRPATLFDANTSCFVPDEQ